MSLHPAEPPRSKDAKTLLDQAIDLLQKEEDPQQLPREYVEILNNILEKYSDAPEALTAKIMLIDYLGKTGYTDEQKKEKVYCQELVEKHPHTWQGCLAHFNIVVICGIEKKFEEQIAEAKDALKNIDFEVLKNSHDRAYLILYGPRKEKPYEIREALKTLLAIAYAETGRFAEAEQVFKAIEDKDLATNTAKTIDYLKKAPELKKIEIELRKKAEEQRKKQEEAKKEAEIREVEDAKRKIDDESSKKK